MNCPECPAGAYGLGRELPHSSFGEDELPYLPLMNMRNSVFLNQLEFHVDCFVHYFSCFVQNSRVHIRFYKRSLICRKRQTSKVFFWISLLMFPCPVRTDFCRNPYYKTITMISLVFSAACCRPTPLIWGCFHGNLRVPPNGPPKK